MWWGLQHIITRALWANVKTQEKNVISSLLYMYTFSKVQHVALETCCFADDFWPGAGFNCINTLASRVLTALQLCGTLEAGFNCINVLASRVLTALQPRDTLLSQSDILKIGICPGNGHYTTSTYLSGQQYLMLILGRRLTTRLIRVLNRVTELWPFEIKHFWLFKGLFCCCEW